MNAVTSASAALQQAGEATSKLAALARMTVIVADSGDLDAIRRVRPQDCTTNPSLLLKAAATTPGRALLLEAVDWARQQKAAAEALPGLACDRFGALLVRDLVNLVPGLVSIEVDADLSHDADATARKGREIIDMMANLGVTRDRLLIKVAGTWEGIEAARRLQAQDINCNVTLIFSAVQAMASTQAGAFLISPFVGRVTDWHVQRGEGPFAAEVDPGVVLVRQIFSQVKSSGAQTVVMGASFRTTGQIEALAGCDRLTVAPALIEALAAQQGEVARRLQTPSEPPTAAAPVDEARFRAELASNIMASEKLTEGIRQFSADLQSLRALVAGVIAA